MGKLLEKEDETLKNWSLTIKQGRILIDSDHLIIDKFQTNKTLSKWLGINGSITDEEGGEPMREFIYQELVIGQGRLPHWSSNTLRTLMKGKKY